MACSETGGSEASSTLSNIIVSAARGRTMDGEDHSRTSTPLSLLGSRSPTPVISSQSSFTVDDEIDAQTLRKRKGVGSSASSRNISGLTGVTLTDDTQDETRSVKRTKRESAFPTELPPRLGRKKSVKEAVKKAAQKVKSVLGKRGRGKMLRELDTGNGGLLEEIDFDEVQSIDEQPTKRVKRETNSGKAQTTTVPTSVSRKPAPRGKAWMNAGLYVGQSSSADSGKNERKKLQKKRPHSMLLAEAISETPTSFMSMPMFGFLDHDRDFKIPYDIYAPTFRKGDEKPKDWHQLNKNRLVGEAKELWEKDAPLARSLCMCRRPTEGQLGCDDDCLNRAMHYECDDNNCGLPAAQCSNRAFTDLTHRMRKGGAFDVGVEVVKTYACGFGVKATREFGPGEIIMEYTGEIISEAECQRRMRELYAGKQSYYIMEFDQGFHIDGTKGSMARFVNHSCEPNCEVRLVKVKNTPRMAIFAGPGGILTGEELTYDYNFDNFSDNKQACYCGTASCRGHLARRLNASEQKIRDREERERQIELEKEARKLAAQQEREREKKASRGSNWRGWVTYTEIKEDLKQEKARRDAADKNSSRAQRLAARHTGVPLEPEKKEKRPQSKRAVSTASKTGSSKFAEHLTEEDEDLGSFVSQSIARLEELEQSLQRVASVDVIEDAADPEASAPAPAPAPARTKSQLVKKSTAKAASMSKTVLKTVERAVVDSLRQGKVKMMRQSTISFTKIS